MRALLIGPSFAAFCLLLLNFADARRIKAYERYRKVYTEAEWDNDVQPLLETLVREHRKQLRAASTPQPPANASIESIVLLPPLVPHPRTTLPPKTPIFDEEFRSKRRIKISVRSRKLGKDAKNEPEETVSRKKKYVQAAPLLHETPSETTDGTVLTSPRIDPRNLDLTGMLTTTISPLLIGELLEEKMGETGTEKGGKQEGNEREEKEERKEREKNGDNREANPNVRSNGTEDVVEGVTSAEIDKLIGAAILEVDDEAKKTAENATTVAPPNSEVPAVEYSLGRMTRIEEKSAENEEEKGEGMKTEKEDDQVKKENGEKEKQKESEADLKEKEAKKELLDGEKVEEKDVGEKKQEEQISLKEANGEVEEAKEKAKDRGDNGDKLEVIGAKSESQREIPQRARKSDESAEVANMIRIDIASTSTALAPSVAVQPIESDRIEVENTKFDSSALQPKKYEPEATNFRARGTKQLLVPAEIPVSEVPLDVKALAEGKIVVKENGQPSIPKDALPVVDIYNPKDYRIVPLKMKKQA